MTGQEVVRRTPMQEVLLEVASDSFAAKLQNALPDTVSVQKFQSVVVTAIKQNPDVIVGDRDSLYNAVVKCAQDGLLPDGRDAALVVFKGKVQYLPMFGGLRKVAAEDGFTLNAQVVYENDDFDYELGATPWVRHKPAKLGADRGAMIGAYATATDTAGRTYGPEVMDKTQIYEVKSMSRAQNGDLWKKWEAEAWRKTVARRLFKQLPRGIDTSERVDRVLRASDEEFDLPGPERMTEEQANIAATVTQLPAAAEEEVALREDPADRASDAVLNRIAHLQGQVGEAGALMTLRGVFGADTAAELAPDDAERYARMLEDAVGEALEGEVVDEGQDSPGAAVAHEGEEAGAATPTAAAASNDDESPYKRAARRATGS